MPKDDHQNAFAIRMSTLDKLVKDDLEVIQKEIKNLNEALTKLNHSSLPDDYEKHLIESSFAKQKNCSLRFFRGTPYSYAGEVVRIRDSVLGATLELAEDEFITTEVALGLTSTGDWIVYSGLDSCYYIMDPSSGEKFYSFETIADLIAYYNP